MSEVIRFCNESSVRIVWGKLQSFKGFVPNQFNWTTKEDVVNERSVCASGSTAGGPNNLQVLAENGKMYATTTEYKNAQSILFIPM